MKVCYLFILLYVLTGAPSQANAGFFDFVSNIMGKNAQADEAPVANIVGSISDVGVFSNSQTMLVLETSSIDPNTKNVNSTKDLNIIEGGAISSDSLAVGIGLESVSNGEMTTYLVQEGDTLSEIAQHFDISTNTVRWENNITGNNLKIGQSLNILPVTGVKHTIKKGDTLGGIADKYDADTEDIKVFNGIESSSQLKVGDVLYVPNGIIKVAAPVKKPTSSLNKGRTDSGDSSSVKVSSGYYSWPTSGRVTSSYGPRRGGFHYGIDIGVSRGSKVSAAATGIVVETVSYCVEGATSCGGRYGNYIVVEHSNGTFTRYAHLSNVSVSTGQSVSKGEKIGTSGNTGHSTGPHLHFQIEKSNGSTIRPTF